MSVPTHNPNIATNETLCLHQCTVTICDYIQHGTTTVTTIFSNKYRIQVQQTLLHLSIKDNHIDNLAVTNLITKI